MNPKRITFLHAPFEDAVHNVMMGLIASRGRDVYPSGTATIVSPGLAVTARHVVEDIVAHFRGGDRRRGSRRADFNIIGCHIVDNSHEGTVWNVRHIWPSKLSDLALLYIEPLNDRAKGHAWRLPMLDFDAPPQKTKITAYGYPTPTESLAGDEYLWKVKPMVSSGEVVEVHKLRRDSSRLNFPCFQTNARFDGSMSGGPVFNANGAICGLVCSSLPALHGEEEHVSYAVSLLPMLAIRIDVIIDGAHRQVKFLNLIKLGYPNVQRD